MANDQNTIAGSGGGALTTPVGNSWLDSLSGLADVGAKFSNVYSSFLESNQTNKLAEAQKVTPPQQTTPSFQVTSAADFLSDPQRVKKAAIYGLVAVIAVGSLIIIAKKA